MAFIPMEDIQLLWDEMGGNKSWSSLRLRLSDLQSEERIHEDRFDENTVYTLLWEVGTLERSDAPFPDTPEQLHEFLNQRVDNQGIV
jgi:hypothetical protein